MNGTVYLLQRLLRHSSKPALSLPLTLQNTFWHADTHTHVACHHRCTLIRVCAFVFAPTLLISHSSLHIYWECNKCCSQGLVGWMQMCLAAAATLASFKTLTASILRKVLPREFARWTSRGATAAVVKAIVALSVARSAALVINYGAPMRLYRHLPQVSHQAGKHWSSPGLGFLHQVTIFLFHNSLPNSKGLLC